MRLDFHLHTCLSDGALAPHELLAAVRQARLQAWAVTDHDTLAGFRTLRGEPGLVPGVEVTAGREGREVHIVGLGVDPDDQAFAAFLAGIRAIRVERLERLIQRLGLEARLTVEGLRIASGSGIAVDSIGRHHLARALVRLGRVTSVQAAFSEFLGDDLVAELDLEPYPLPAVVCAAIRAAGGVAILAHPGLYRVLERIALLLDLGCDGVEVRHPQLDPTLAAGLDALVAERGLLASCGSDLHYLGARRPGEHRLSGERAGPLLRRLGIGMQTEE